jgi:oligoribonuclease NrnB/cAMP/cGMP phosphodiesterase (DHH superfamily)
VKLPLVIYHAACKDGFTAAWIAHKFFDGAVELHPAFYGTPPPSVADRKVYIIDFSYKRSMMEALHAAAHDLLVLDHHKTAEADLAGLPYTRFDMERSGAGMAWDYFFQGERPVLVKYVEDRDIWRNALPFPDEVSAYVGSTPMTLKDWEELSKLDAKELIERGAMILRKTKAYIAAMKGNMRMVEFEGHTVPVVNAPQFDVSELGSALAEGQPFALVWWQRHDGRFQYSLRSIGDFDVSEIAKKHGGGGHKNAAGFEAATLIL